MSVDDSDWLQAHGKILQASGTIYLHNLYSRNYNEQEQYEYSDQYLLEYLPLNQSQLQYQWIDVSALFSAVSTCRRLFHL